MGRVPIAIPSESDAKGEDVEEDREREQAVGRVEAHAILTRRDSHICCCRAHRPRRLRGGHLANLSARQDDTALTLKNSRSRVDLAMAICAQHHALQKLLCDRFPWTRHPISRNPELLFVSVPMVELEERIGDDDQAAIAPTAHEVYCSCLFAVCSHRASIVVPPSVAGSRIEGHTFPLRRRAFPRSR